MPGPDKSLIVRLGSLEQHLQNENPVLLKAVKNFKLLDQVGYNTGLLETDESYSMQISWWPLISILGTFSAGKSSFINSYLGVKLQKTGNQAVDDKFTVICYGEESAGKVLPGLALDADLRFPFYKISDELEKVEEGEGNRIDAYLQLKISDSDAVNGKIVIDSPGFDADQQRTATLRITDRIIDLSDLVLVFFDARHPEPGAMQDTLEHLVEDTIDRSDSNKFLYILNQIDTAAAEDNPEEVVSAWQRALSQAGLTAGRFFTIYNDDAALPFPTKELEDRFRKKRDVDMTDIMQRIDQVEVERAYRVIGALEKEARDIKQVHVPAVSSLLQKWSKRVLIADSVAFSILLLLVLFIAISMGWLVDLATLTLALFSSPISVLISIAVLLGVFFAVHFFFRNKVAHYMLKAMKGTEQEKYVNAFKQSTRFYRSIFLKKPLGWTADSKNKITTVIEASAAFVQKLNDQFTNPSGKSKK